MNSKLPGYRSPGLTQRREEEEEEASRQNVGSQTGPAHGGRAGRDRRQGQATADGQVAVLSSKGTLLTRLVSGAAGGVDVHTTIRNVSTEALKGFHHAYCLSQGCALRNGSHCCHGAGGEAEYTLYISRTGRGEEPSWPQPSSRSPCGHVLSVTSFNTPGDWLRESLMHPASTVCPEQSAGSFVNTR